MTAVKMTTSTQLPSRPRSFGAPIVAVPAGLVPGAVVRTTAVPTGVRTTAVPTSAIMPAATPR